MPAGAGSTGRRLGFRLHAGDHPRACGDGPVGGDDPHRLLVLHEIAAQRWSEGRVGTPAAEDSSPTPGHTPTGQQPQGRRLRVVVTAAAVVTALSVTVALLPAVRLTEACAQLADERSGVSATAVATVSESMVPVVYTYELEQRDGR
ncbi:hypothetical protein [Streptomyces sp. NPDC060322]|uniref:hypothetical protein n=1 Tax=Streptomyces sp. NPDC060322 TaxID=3347097 RepID=UPI0036614C66